MILNILFGEEKKASFFLTGEEKDSSTRSLFHIPESRGNSLNVALDGIVGRE